MKKQIKLILLQAVLVAFVALCLFLPVLISAGSLEPVNDPAPTMHTLEDIYTLVENIDAMVDPGPCVPCDPVGAGVEKTGQTLSSQSGDDGDLEKGIAWPNPRFSDNGDGTVTDFLTGLIWLKNANCYSTRLWSIALSDCNNLADASCGLTDGSIAGDWRLPNAKELQSLIDYSRTNPVLPTVHPFSNVQSDLYWTSTSYPGAPTMAWGVNMNAGNINYYNSSSDPGYGGDSGYVWPVRDGN